MPVDDNFLDFYGIPLLAGSDFPDYKGMEAPEYYIINETALKKLGFTDPEEAIGRQFKLIFDYPDIFKGGQITGVCRDFHFFTMAKPVKPLVMFQKHIWFWCFLVRVDKQHLREAADYVNETWTRIYPDYPFEYHFVDDLYASLYKNEITQARILVIGTILTVLIACLGLIVLMAYWVENRTKEIGIRKVMGASTIKILLWSGSRVLLWILIAIAFAMPLSLWTVKKYWLQNFTYTTEIRWFVFVLAGLSVMVLAFLVIIIQTYKAASRNPSESLRYE
jgi:putative ABC transport system permease protein